MDESGFIRLSRKFFKHPFWTEDRTRSLAEAWLDLIASARFEVAPERLMVKMKTIQIRRGELRASQRFLAKRWNWSVGKVNRFMNLLEDEGMIERRQEHSETIVSIANYDLYNPFKKAEDEHRRIGEMEDFGEKNEDCGFKNEQQCEHQKNAKTFTIPNVQKLGELNNEHQKDAKLNKRGSPTDHPRRQTKESKEGKERKEVYGEIIDFFNETCVSLPSVKLTPKRRGNIRARIREHSIPEVYTMIENAAASTFLAGQNRRDWQATFDWLFRPNNFVKVLEGNYKDKNNNQNQEFQNEEQLWKGNVLK
jgi:DNA-binding Lrp family transcriptional regulator